MNVGYCALVSRTPNIRIWPKIAALYHTCTAGRKKDVKLYIAKGRANVEDTHITTQDGLMGTLLYSLSFTHVEK